MIIYSKVIEAPANEPIEISEAKAWLKLDGNGEDAIVNALIVAARRMCENYAGLSFVTQTRVVKLDRFPGWNYYPVYTWSHGNHKIVLPYGPVQQVTSFTYVDSGGTTIPMVLDTDFTQDLHSDLACVYPADLISGWPSTKMIPNAVSIEYVTGYQNDPDTIIELQNRIPAEIKQAILMQVATLYENRQDEVAGGLDMIGWNSRAILDTVKVYWNANA